MFVLTLWLVGFAAIFRNAACMPMYAIQKHEVLSAQAIRWGLSTTLFDRLAQKHVPMLLDVQLLARLSETELFALDTVYTTRCDEGGICRWLSLGQSIFAFQ